MSATIVFAQGSRQMANNNNDLSLRSAIRAENNNRESAKARKQAIELIEARQAISRLESQVKALKQENETLKHGETEYAKKSRVVWEYMFAHIHAQSLGELLKEDSIQSMWELAEFQHQQSQDSLLHKFESALDHLLSLSALAAKIKSEQGSHRKQKVISHIPGIFKLILVNETGQEVPPLPPFKYNESAGNPPIRPAPAGF